MSKNRIKRGQVRKRRRRNVINLPESSGNGGDESESPELQINRTEDVSSGESQAGPELDIFVADTIQLDHDVMVKEGQKYPVVDGHAFTPSQDLNIASAAANRLFYAWGVEFSRKRSDADRFLAMGEVQLQGKLLTPGQPRALQAFGRAPRSALAICRMIAAVGKMRAGKS